jgi:hypothetical protein
MMKVLYIISEESLDGFVWVSFIAVESIEN